MPELQPSFDPSILDGQMTAGADIQACQVTGSNQPETVFPMALATPQRKRPSALTTRTADQGQQADVRTVVKRVTVVRDVRREHSTH